MVMLVGVMVAVAMHLVLVAEVVMRALGGSRRGYKSESRDEHSGGQKGFQHGHFLYCPKTALGRRHSRRSRVNAS
jgi:hypothetical protein